MNYEFYDRVGNHMGLSEDPEGTPVTVDEEITNWFEGEVASRWKVVSVSDPVDGVQKVTVCLIS